MTALSAAQQQEVIATTTQWIERANALYCLQLPSLEICFDLGGAQWGHYVRHGKRSYFRYNPLLFAQYYQASLEETIPHEVAHYVVDKRYTRRKVRPHGKEWREVMQQFGFHHPQVTHNLDLSAIPRRRQQRFSYRCDCGPVELSATRHNRIIHRAMRYHCRICGSEIVPAEKPDLQ